jgi:peptidoglycan hydrolase-like protein with peptidoglycan-binding domain
VLGGELLEKENAMRKKIHAAPVGRMLAALIVVLVPAAGPATAEANDGGKSAEVDAALIAPGAGYADPQGSERVRALQRRLRRADESPGAVDGRFGPLTEAAVRQFQSREGIVADGLVGRSTRLALARTAGPAPRSPTGNGRSPSGRLQSPSPEASRRPRDTNNERPPQVTRTRRMSRRDR